MASYGFFSGVDQSSFFGLEVQEQAGNDVHQCQHTPIFFQSAVQGPRAASDLGDGEIIRRSIFNAESYLSTTVQIWCLPPGCNQGLHVHKHDDELLGEIEEIYICLSGSGVVRRDEDDASQLFQAGDAVLVPPGIVHGVHNTGTTPLVLAFLFGPQKTPQPHRLRGIVFWPQSDAQHSGVYFSRLQEAASITNENFHGGLGSNTRHSVFCGESQMEDTVQTLTLLPGSSQGLHCHAADQECDRPDLGTLEEIYLCVTGQGTFLGGENPDMPIRPGDAILVRSGITHGVLNDGLEPLVMIIVWGYPQLASLTEADRFSRRGSLLPQLAKLLPQLAKL